MKLSAFFRSFIFTPGAGFPAELSLQNLEMNKDAKELVAGISKLPLRTISREQAAGL